MHGFLSGKGVSIALFLVYIELRLGIGHLVMFTHNTRF